MTFEEILPGLKAKKKGLDGDFQNFLPSNSLQWVDLAKFF